MTEENHCYGCGTQRCTGDAEARTTCKAWNPDYKAPWEQSAETQKDKRYNYRFLKNLAWQLSFYVDLYENDVIKQETKEFLKYINNIKLDLADWCKANKSKTIK